MEIKEKIIKLNFFLKKKTNGTAVTSKVPGLVLDAGDPKVHKVPSLHGCGEEWCVNSVPRAFMQVGLFRKLWDLRGRRVKAPQTR